MKELKLSEIRKNTVNRLKAAGADSAVLSCDMLLMHFFGFSRLFIMTNPDYLLPCETDEEKAVLADFTAAVVRLCRGEPIQYITGIADFMGEKWTVTPDVLIPRGDTEILAQEMLQEIEKKQQEKGGSTAVLDLCCGSGCLGITAAKHYPAARVTCSDLSAAALRIALENCRKILGAYDRVDFTCGDFFGGLAQDARFDLIVSNPPYIPTADIRTLDRTVRDHEPHLALDGGADGLDAYRVITEAAPAHLFPGGVILFEVGIRQAAQVSALLEKNGFCEVRIVRDFGNIERVVAAKLTASSPSPDPAGSPSGSAAKLPGSSSTGKSAAPVPEGSTSLAAPAITKRSATAAKAAAPTPEGSAAPEDPAKPERSASAPGAVRTAGSAGDRAVPEAATPEATAPAPPQSPLEKAITELPGIKTARAAAFARLGVVTVRDLLELYPTRYEDRSRRTPVSRLTAGDAATVLVRIYGKTSRPLRKGLTATFFSAGDASGRIKITFYNQDYVKNTIRVGGDYVFYGRVATEYGGSAKQLLNPAFADASDPGKLAQFERLLPVYPCVRGLSQGVIRDAIREAMRTAETAMRFTAPDPGSSGILPAAPELPQKIRDRYGLIPRADAQRSIHFPEDQESAQKARKRLVFDELAELQMMLFHIKSSVDTTAARGICFQKVDMDAFYASLPFRLTDGQEKVIGEIFADMEAPKIMNRLVIGDVGSGKTVIAVAAMYKAIRNGYQAIYMAPTEILAEQHVQTIRALLTPLGIRVGLLTGSLGAAEKKKVRKEIAEGKIDCMIGTHALIQKGVTFRRPGIVITDEQHRFGVRQRAMLAESGNITPDILVMTATPIPRTLALILYGDLDISTLDVLPTGRLPIKTYAATGDMRGRVYKWVLANVKEGFQAYIVHPLIDSEERKDAAGSEGPELPASDGQDAAPPGMAAVQNYEQLSRTVFAGISTGLLHGKMKAAEKEAVMRRFSAGEISVLFTTTVIEVGVDVPNATIMVIENADRFGLAQLHQLRGRVGRGTAQSHCTLISDAKTKIATERIRLLCKTVSGFEISEKDLELRGPGELFGTAQHGIPTLKIANLYDDIEILKMAQAACEEIITLLRSETDGDARREYEEYYRYVIRKTPKLLQL